MTEAEKLLRAAGGVRVESGHHIVYLVAGERFVIHHGTRVSYHQLREVRARLRRLGLLGRRKRRKGA